MSPARSLAAALVLLASTAAAWSPPRYVPAPAGKPYFMLNAGLDALGTVSTSEDGTIPALDNGTVTHPFTSKWTYNTGEIGAGAGYGLGSLWFIKALDASLYLPFDLRQYSLSTYLADDKPDYADLTLHGGLREGRSGKGLGNVSLSTLALLVASAENSMWLTAGFKVAFAGSNPAEQVFTRILHGDASDPGVAEGVTRLVPVLAGIKTVAGQRIYLDLEYRIPVGQESFNFVSPVSQVAGRNFTDANLPFTETIKPGGIAVGTLGLETSLSVFGIVPSVELNFRQYQQASWKENGADGLTPSWPGIAGWQYPTMTPDFLQSAAWSIGGLPLKNNTVVEVGLVGTSRSGTDQYKLGVAYVTSSFGNSLGVRFGFTSLFVEKPSGPRRAVPGHAEAEEMNVSPVLSAPAAPAGRILTAVAFPVSAVHSGAMQEDADWLGRAIRGAVGKLKGYELFPEKDMAQLAYEPCGDVECGTRFGRALRVPAVIVSAFAKNEAGYGLTVSMINVADGTLAGSQSVSGANLDAVKDQLPGLFDKLTAPPAAAAPAVPPPPPAR